MKSKRTRPLFYPLIFFVVIFGGCADVTTTRPDQASITALADTYYARFFETYPEYAYFVDTPMDRHDGITSNNLSDIQAWQDFEDKLYVELSKIDERNITDRKARITYWLLKEELESSIGMRVCRRNLWDVNQEDWQANWAAIAEFI